MPLNPTWLRSGCQEILIGLYKVSRLRLPSPMGGKRELSLLWIGANMPGPNIPILPSFSNVLGMKDSVFKRLVVFALSYLSLACSNAVVIVT
jgi:hypothetical protein